MPQERLIFQPCSRVHHISATSDWVKAMNIIPYNDSSSATHKCIYMCIYMCIYIYIFFFLIETLTDTLMPHGTKASRNPPTGEISDATGRNRTLPNYQ